MNEISSKRALRRETDRSPALRRLGWYHSFQFPDGTAIEGVQTIHQLQERWNRFPLPADLTGKRVLDVGAWDGWFSFEAERRGALVVAADSVEIPNLLAAKKRLGSRIDYRVTDLYKLPALELGAFDYVLFLGVLYHVRHPLLALDIICSLTRDIAVVESAVIDGPAYESGVREEIPTLEFFETDELGGHFDNWFGPSVSCLMAMCRAAGFATVELLSVTATTASVACYRRWPPLPASLPEPPPQLAAVVNNADLGVNVASTAQDYLAWWFTLDRELTRNDLEFEVGGFGCHAVTLTKRDGNGWSANTMVPPGIARGWVDARMRTAHSPYSPPKRIAVDVPVRPIGPLMLDAVQDGTTWEKNVVSAGSSHMILWILGLGENADRANILVVCDGARLLVDFVGEPDENNARQVNARLLHPPAGHKLPVSISHGKVSSNQIEVTVLPSPPARP